MNKAIIAAVSLILLVGVVIGVVASVNRSTTDVEKVSTSIKAIDTICAPTDYKDVCTKTLESSVSNNGSIDPKELLKATINATIAEVKAALHLSNNMGNKTTDAMNQAALSDCKDLMEYATAELQASFSEVGDKDMHTLPDRVDEIKNWLSAVISYQETCKDGITHPELKLEMENGMVNASQLTSNALAIVSGISDILTSFDIPFNFSSLTASRELIEGDHEGGLNHADGDGYPTWVSAGDRRLLAFKDNDRPKPNVVVAKDGSGNFKSINDALKAMPKKYSGRYVIYVKAGVYVENVIVEKDMINVFMYGDGPRKTLVTGKKNYVDGTPTYQTATFAAIGKGFIAKSMGFSNTAGPEKHQAVALRVQSDMSAFVNCRMDAYQDTLYVQTHRQFYRNCVISGTVDFIFGDAASLLQNCLLVVRKPMDNQQNIVTAQGRTDKRQTTGIVIHNCRIVPEAKLYPTRFKTRSYLGRPWKQYSRTVIMESTIGDFIQPDGWMPWDRNFALDTLFYAEYANRGPGAGTNKRIKWKGYKVINRKEALQFTAGPFLQGNQWLRNIKAPYMLGLRR
ncbi:pectinesterase-like [Magnolia sinica]|uniref:pectinesterase-like n=1 Tax=Magnolia sinica TaxID=86752 RepID=UPI00265865C5|nr:pectinesterase-like [Magnolia sinica]